MQYTETELSDLIKSVEAEFSSYLALAKSDAHEEEEHKAEPKEEKEEHKEHEEEESEKHDEEPEGDEHKEHEEEHEEEAHHDDDESPEHDEDEHEGDDDDEEGHDYDEDDMNQMHAMYSSMKKGELKAHHDCIKKCLDAHKEGAGMEKSEAILEIPELKTEEVEMLKSEYAAEKAKTEQLQKSLDMVTEILTKMVKKSAPAAKAVTSLEVINKSEILSEQPALSKSEITEKLMAAASRPDLAKNDRAAINAFYLSTNPNIESIRHLLK